jgi:23S rRNA maturation mini-RNase III
MYQKFIQYAMPRTDTVLIYSMKNSLREQEKCIVELSEREKKIKYLLNPKTRVFEKMEEKIIKKGQNNRTKTPSKPTHEEK